jgi:hypothetical protein
VGGYSVFPMLLTLEQEPTCEFIGLDLGVRHWKHGNNTAGTDVTNQVEHPISGPEQLNARRPPFQASS